MKKLICLLSIILLSINGQSQCFSAINGPSRACSGSTLNFEIAVSTPENGHWTTNNGSLVIQDSTNYSLEIENIPVGTHGLIWIPDGCPEGADTINVEIEPTLSPNVQLTAEYDLGYTEVSASTSEITGSSLFSWYLNGQMLSFEIDDSVFVSEDLENFDTIVLRVEVNLLSDCYMYAFASDTLIINGITSTLQSYCTTNTQIETYPNPILNQVNIRIPNSTLTSIIICDLTGKQLIYHNQTEDLTTIDVSSLKKGQYILQVGRYTEIIQIE